MVRLNSLTKLYARVNLSSCPCCVVPIVLDVDCDDGGVSEGARMCEL